MELNRIFNSLSSRSSFSFLVFFIFAVSAALFIINKGKESIADIEVLENQPIFSARKQILQGGGSEDIFDFSDWKTYINKPYKYEIKYPNGWEVVESENAASIDFNNPANINTGLVVYGNPRKLPVGEWLNSSAPSAYRAKKRFSACFEVYGDSSSLCGNYAERPITLPGGISGIDFYEIRDNATKRFIVFSESKLIFAWSFKAGVIDDPWSPRLSAKDLKNFEHIINSFRFLR